MIDGLLAALLILGPGLAVAGLRRVHAEPVADLPQPAVAAPAGRVLQPKPAPVDLDDEPAEPARQGRAERDALVRKQDVAIAAMVGAASAIGEACLAFEDDPASGAYQLTDRDIHVLARTSHLFALALAPPASEAWH